MWIKEDFRYTRWASRISRSVQICLSITLILGLNYLAAHYFIRKDLTNHRTQTLSPESLAYITKLEKPVEIIITIPPKSSVRETAEIYRMVTRLANEYTYTSRGNPNGKISVEHINPFKQTLKAQEISTRYGIKKENAIIIASGNHHRQICGNDLFTFKNGDIEGFRGEQVFTSSILDVTQDKKEKIYFITGHGEMRVNDVDPLRGLSQVSTLLQNHNFEIDQIDLSKPNGMPEDVSLMILVSPQTPLLMQEVETLRSYLSEKNGRLLVFTDPAHSHGLDELFYDWGIRTDDMVILDHSKNFQASGGDLIIRQFAEHPITQFLLDYQLSVLMGMCRPVRPDIGAPLDQRRKIFPLIASSKTSWGERSYAHTNELGLDHNDLPGPVPIATVSECSVSSRLGIKVSGGRLIVFGNSDFIANNRIHALGNKILFQNTVNWSLDRNETLNIPPRSLNKHQLTISKEDLLRIGLTMLSFPGTLACLGLFIYTIRRR